MKAETNQTQNKNIEKQFTLCFYGKTAKKPNLSNSQRSMRRTSIENNTRELLK